MTKFEFNQYVYETSIPNNYLSWGWSHKNNNKIVPFIYNYPIIKIPRIPIRNKSWKKPEDKFLWQLVPGIIQPSCRKYQNVKFRTKAVASIVSMHGLYLCPIEREVREL